MKRTILAPGHELLSYRIHEVTPYINWIYFFHAWGFQPRFAAIANIHGCDSCRALWLTTFPEEERTKASEAMQLFKEANRMLGRLDETISIHCIFRLCQANADGDNLLIEGTTFPLLRQQTPQPDGGPFLCLSDFVRPYSIGYANDDVWGYGGKTNKSYLIAKYVDRWHPANITDDPYNPATQWVAGYYPALRHNFSNTSDNGSRWNYGISVWLPQATYLRLKSMEIGYNLPKSFMKRIGLNSARIFVNGSNLLTFCNKALKDADPEREERDWGANLAYPLMRTYNFGLNINF